VSIFGVELFLYEVKIVYFLFCDPSNVRI